MEESYPTFKRNVHFYCSPILFIWISHKLHITLKVLTQYVIVEFVEILISVSFNVDAIISITFKASSLTSFLSSQFILTQPFLFLLLCDFSVFHVRCWNDYLDSVQYFHFLP